MSMSLKLSHIKLSNEIEAVKNPDNDSIILDGKPESLLVSVCARSDTEEGSLDVCFEVEIRDFKGMTFAEIESLAVSRASRLLAK